MIYQSTRSPLYRASAREAVLRGLAPDGGLYVPDPSVFSDFDWRSLMGLDFLGMAARVLGALLPDYENLPALVRAAYENRFSSPEITPTRAVGDRFVLELFHGPTAAFKDVALSMLPQLMTAARTELGVDERILILTATSGDTGKAALAGFRDVPGIGILVFYPKDGVSPVQKAQMVTQEGANVGVCAVEGNFDDAQTRVKRIFASLPAVDLPDGGRARLSSANSINIGRLAPQVVYYFKAYADLLRQGAVRCGAPVDFCVPTGNFGDILAGYFAKRLGLPVGTLICASNKNDVLTDFLRTGVYDRNRPFYRTVSPSMDILVSSNLERLLYLSSDGDTAFTAGCMQALAETGRYQIPADLLRKLQSEFRADFCGDEETKRTIGRVWNDCGYLTDTHTAVAWAVADRCRSARPLVVLSTASAYKFPAAVLEALGEPVPADEFAAMDRIYTLTGAPVPASLAALAGKPALHSDAIAPADMAAYVKTSCKSFFKMV